MQVTAATPRQASSKTVRRHELIADKIGGAHGSGLPVCGWYSNRLCGADGSQALLRPRLPLNTPADLVQGFESAGFQRLTPDV